MSEHLKIIVSEGGAESCTVKNQSKMAKQKSGRSCTTDRRQKPLVEEKCHL